MIGPRNPLVTVGERIVLSHMVVSQQYEDGTVYRVAMPRGSNFGVMNICVGLIPMGTLHKAEWLTVHSPWDVEDHDDNNLYMSLWVANG